MEVTSAQAGKTGNKAEERAAMFRFFWVCIITVFACVAFPVSASASDIVLVQSGRVIDHASVRIIECPAEFEFAEEALLGSWTTQSMSNYRCEFHPDVAIRQIEVTAQGGRFDTKFFIEQDEGTDKEVDLEVCVLGEDGNVLAREREQIELDEGEMTKDWIRVRLPKKTAAQPARLRVIIHGIGWG